MIFKVMGLDEIIQKQNRVSGGQVDKGKRSKKHPGEYRKTRSRVKDCKGRRRERSVTWKAVESLRKELFNLDFALSMSLTRP